VPCFVGVCARYLQRMGSPSWIAEEQVVFVHPDGHRESGRIAVGLPFRFDALECRCSVALDGLEKVTVPIRGDSPLQALLLSLQLLGFRLHEFVTRGGRVLTADGDELPLSAFFGPLLRAAA